MPGAGNPTGAKAGLGVRNNRVRYGLVKKQVQETGTATCCSCGRVLPVGDFLGQRGDTVIAKCLPCHSRYNADRNNVTDPHLLALREDNHRRTDGKRTCTTCLEVKGIEAFGTSGKTWRFHNTCRRCKYGDSPGRELREARDAMAKQGLRLCAQCREGKPLDQFYRSSRGGYQSKCIPCYNKRHVDPPTT